MEKKYFSYIRVSTAKQGERGVSLQEQHDAIVRYAHRQDIEIIRSFEEQETAAKRGRPIFNQMLNMLRHGQAHGVIIHKIDRGARNLKDWADLGELIDAGVEVHFANESLDLNTRGGRLSADIQAVVAADYIRNLREETRKGFYGRLKQGFLPIGAPIGYLDCGGGQPKVPDPAKAALIHEAFDLYASGNYSLPRLVEEMYRKGLRNRRGGKVSLTGVSTILNNPFYIGVIRIRKTGERFAGAHKPIVDKRIFDTVQLILKGKTVVRTHRHEFPFSRMIRCALCGQTAMAELQKGHTYYRCHTKRCATKTQRAESIEEELRQAFVPLRLSNDEIAYARRWFNRKREGDQEEVKRQLEACHLQSVQIRERLTRLTDAYLDGAIDKALLDERRANLLSEQAGVKQRIADLEAGNNALLVRLEDYLELVIRAENLHKLALSSEKRILVKRLTSNLTIGPQYAAITLGSAAQMIAARPQLSCSAPHRGVPRTWDTLLPRLLSLLADKKEPEQVRLAA
jgi:DNA invertase Pin-like site-specific DNA recombinase